MKAALRQRIASVLALMRRIWSLRGLPLEPVGEPDSSQIEMAQKLTLSHPFEPIQAQGKCPHSLDRGAVP